MIARFGKDSGDAEKSGSLTSFGMPYSGVSVTMLWVMKRAGTASRGDDEIGARKTGCERGVLELAKEADDE